LFVFFTKKEAILTYSTLNDLWGCVGFS